MNGADFVLRSLVQDGVDVLFLVPGGLVDPFLPAIARTTGLAPVVAAQEGGAAFMADGYARASGKFGAVLCIGGPGATNTVTAISAAYTDHSPVLLLTGAVANFMQGLGYFQDATAGAFDDSRVLAPVTAESLQHPGCQTAAGELAHGGAAHARRRARACPSQHPGRRPDRRNRRRSEAPGQRHSRFRSRSTRRLQATFGAPWRASALRRASRFSSAAALSPTTHRRLWSRQRSVSTFRSPRPNTPRVSFLRITCFPWASSATPARGRRRRRCSTGTSIC